MTQEKLRKTITACAVAATAFIVFLLGVLLYQGITYAVLAKREKNLQTEIKKLEQLNNKDEETAAYYESIMGQEWLAFQNGFVRPGD